MDKTDDYGIATPEYVKSLNKNYDPAKMGFIPFASLVKTAFLVRRRVFVNGVHETVLEDWMVSYRDGTYDAISLCEPQDKPQEGEWFMRSNTQHPFTCWHPSDYDGSPNPAGLTQFNKEKL